MKQIFILLISFLITTITMQTAQCQLNSKDLGNLVEKARNKFDIPAIAVVLANSDSILHSEIRGTRTISNSINATIDDYFHIGSTSKSILAVIAGRFVEQKKIHWTTRIFDVLPELEQQSNPEYKNCTLEDLFLCHAGLKAFTTSEEPFPSINEQNVNRRLEFVKWLLQQPPSSKKAIDGKFEHLYSNASYTTIAVILERVSGKMYEDLLHDFCKNLNINYIFGWPNNHSLNQPWGHGNFIFDKEGTLLDTKNYNNPFEPENKYKLDELIKPAGDISMKPSDFARYTQLHLKGLKGMNGLIKSETINYIDMSHEGFSLGVYNAKSLGVSFAGFDGSAGTFYCRGFIIPEFDLALTIMTNSGNAKVADWLTIKIIKKHNHWWWKIWM